jgi:hypothetical protein
MWLYHQAVGLNEPPPNYTDSKQRYQQLSNQEKGQLWLSYIQSQSGSSRSTAPAGR